MIGDTAGLRAAADQFDRAHCPYQAARPRVLGGAGTAQDGAETPDRLGASPMR